MVVKVAPDLDPTAIETIARLLIRHRIDGVIATNTTLSRDAVVDKPHADEAGGLSGRPLAKSPRRSFARACQGARRRIADHRRRRHFFRRGPREKIEAGAALVQIYTGLIYRGPALVADCVAALAEG
jgi:dihydroorotate dehydrogenase